MGETVVKFTDSIGANSDQKPTLPPAEKTDPGDIIGPGMPDRPWTEEDFPDRPREWSFLTRLGCVLPCGIVATGIILALIMTIL
jgi:hypothetical protein